MSKSMFNQQATMFVVLFAIFFLATGNFFGTIIGCLVNAVIFTWSQNAKR